MICRSSNDLAPAEGNLIQVARQIPDDTSASRAITIGLEAFRRGLRDLGHVEEQNIVLVWRWTKTNPIGTPQ
jgi:hypothetical protein